jgi:hypothetical protein
LIVVDVGHCIDLYSDFARQGKNYVSSPDQESYRVELEDLKREEVRARLRKVFTDPLSLDPTRKATAVTKNLAGKLADVAASLEGGGRADYRAAGKPFGEERGLDIWVEYEQLTTVD